MVEMILRMVNSPEERSRGLRMKRALFDYEVQGTY